MISEIKYKFVSPRSFGILVKSIFPGKFPRIQNLLSNKFFILTSIFKPALQLTTFFIEKPIFGTNPIKTESLAIWNRCFRMTYVTR